MYIIETTRLKHRHSREQTEFGLILEFEVWLHDKFLNKCVQYSYIYYF